MECHIMHYNHPAIYVKCHNMACNTSLFYFYTIFYFIKKTKTRHNVIWIDISSNLLGSL